MRRKCSIFYIKNKIGSLKRERVKKYKSYIKKNKYSSKEKKCEKVINQKFIFFVINYVNV